jgi:ribose transport system substrate-binding protein
LLSTTAEERPKLRSTSTAVLASCLALLALTVAGCGDDDGGGGEGAEGAKITLVQGVKGDEFYVTMGCGAEEAARKAGVDLDITGPDEFAADQQTPVVNAVAAKSPDAILIAPTDTKAMFAPIQQAAENGAKIILVDTTLENPEVAESQIASDNLEGGRLAGEELIKLIGGEGKVMVENVNPGISTTDQRQQGFEEAIEAEEAIEYLGTQFNNDEPAKAAAQVKAQLAKDPDLKGIFATNLFSAEGSANGLREAGKLGEVKMVGFDAGPAQVEQLEEGLVQALIAQKPADIGRQGVEQAVNAIEGRPVKEKITTGYVTVRKDQLDDPKVKDALYKSSC